MESESSHHVVERDLYAAKHSLTYSMTSSSGTQDFPEFMAFATFDGINVGYCDSRGIFKAEIEMAIRFFQDNPQQLETYVNECERLKYVLRSYTEELNQQMNQTEGTPHSLQLAYTQSRNLGPRHLRVQICERENDCLC